MADGRAVEVVLEAVRASYASKDDETPREALDSRFARFGLRPMADADVWALSMAAMVMPDGNPGAEGYLTQVSGTSLFVGRLTVWGRVVAIGIANAGYKAVKGSRRRTYVEGYDESWGRYAVADGLTLALFGRAADAIGKSKDQGYRRIRDFVGGALVNAIEEYRVALEWATGSRRDRVLAGRWEGVTGLNFGNGFADANMGEPHAGLMFAPGCDRVVPVKDMADAYAEPPETLYHGLRPSDWWDATYAKRMRDAPVTLIYAPPRT